MRNSRVHKTGVMCLAALIILTGAALTAQAPAAAERAAVDFEALKKEAPDSVAWIHLPGTGIDYPVVHSTDNDFYLTHLPDSSVSESGSIVIDYRNSPDFTDPNTLVYGHRMSTGTMFGELKNYVSQEYYDTHQIVEFSTPRGDIRVRLFAGYVFDQTKETMPWRFKDADSFVEYIRFVKGRSMFKSDAEVNPGDLLVTLVTCDYEFDYENGRMMLIGKQLNQ